jgi:hypothetical protein
MLARAYSFSVFGGGRATQKQAPPGDVIDFGHVELFWHQIVGPGSGQPSTYGYPNIPFISAFAAVALFF